MKKFPLIIFILILSLPVFADNLEKYVNMGYVGTLPDLTKGYVPTEPQVGHPIIEQVENFNTIQNFKPIPRDNPTFVNIILKQDKTSQYLNDINEFIPMLEKIYNSIDTNENVQLFNAKVYFFYKNAQYFKNKYIEKPEEEYVSFKKLTELSIHAKSVALLRSEAGKYNPYLAYGSAGYIYDPNNITQQLEYLKKEVEETILILKDVN